MKKRNALRSLDHATVVAVASCPYCRAVAGTNCDGPRSHSQRVDAAARLLGVAVPRGCG